MPINRIIADYQNRYLDEQVHVRQMLVRKTQEQKETEMSMTRADYQDIASVLDRCRQYAKYGAQKELWKNTVHEFLTFFQNTRGNFQSSKFMEACGDVDLEQFDGERQRQQYPEMEGALTTHRSGRVRVNPVPYGRQQTVAAPPPQPPAAPYDAMTPAEIRAERNRIMSRMAQAAAPPIMAEVGALSQAIWNDIIPTPVTIPSLPVTAAELVRDYGSRLTRDHINQALLADYNTADVAEPPRRIMDEGIPEEELFGLDDAADAADDMAAEE
jgi:hypothetical protein